jgi:hypothetical protein
LVRSACDEQTIANVAASKKVSPPTVLNRFMSYSFFFAPEFAEFIGGIDT